MNHCESPYFRIGLGYCGPIDCCLMLEYQAKPRVIKQYGATRSTMVQEHPNDTTPYTFSHNLSDGVDAQDDLLPAWHDNEWDEGGEG